MRGRIVIALALAASVGCGGASATMMRLSDDVLRRVRDCTCGERTSFTIVTPRLERSVALDVMDGLQPRERACAASSVAAIRVPPEVVGYRLRIRQTTTVPGPIPPRDFVETRADEIEACVPGRTLRIVSTPAGDRFALSVELMADEPDLDAHERACVLEALEGMPEPQEGAAESVVALGPGAPCRTPSE